MSPSDFTEVNFVKHEFRENRLVSWISYLFSLFIVGFCVLGIILLASPFLKLASSLFLGLSLLRVFSLFHEYYHGAILSKSIPAKILMGITGFVLMSPTRLWKYYHGMHHKDNSKFSSKIMGDFPTLTLEDFNHLSASDKKVYLLKRSFWVILFGYLTVFVISFCFNPFKDNPRKNFVGLISIIFHIGLYISSIFFLGWVNTIFLIFIPLSIFGFLGGLFFYLQHNCKGLVLFDKKDWTKNRAALYSSSFIKMNRFWRFFSANVGFHNVHHLDSKIPHYKLPMAMDSLEKEGVHITTISFSVKSIQNAFKLKVYDTSRNELIAL